MSQTNISLYVTYTLKPGQGPAFAAALKADGVLERVQAEPGCLRYELFAAVDNPDHVLLAECWDSQENMDAHCAGSNFKDIQAIEGQYVTGVDVKRC